MKNHTFKKSLRYLITNLSIILSLFFISDYLCFKISEFKSNSFFSKINFKNITLNYRISKIPFTSFYREVTTKLMRAPLNTTSNKKSIIIFGCSFAFGDHLNENQTFSYKLANLTGAPVYNRAYSGWGIQHMLYQLQHPGFYRRIKNPPSTVIYVFMPHHINRMHYYLFQPTDRVTNLKYKTVNNQLVLDKGNFIKTTALYTTFYNYYIDKYATSIKNIDSNFDNMKLYFSESKKLIDKHYPNTNFVILKYSEQNKGESVENSPKWKELENEGFTILDTDSLTKEDMSDATKYKLPDGHPNEKAWDTITPKLVKALNL